MSDRSGPTGRVEFAFADGLRALAALTIAIYHSYLFTGHTGQARSGLPRAMRVLQLGHLAVPVFIVLSGFVLMLPVARRADGALAGGAAGFLRRRARRILPPYYAALALSLGLIAAAPLLQSRGGTQWDSKLPVTGSGVLARSGVEGVVCGVIGQ